MAEFTVWREVTAAGSFRVRHVDPRVSDKTVTDYVVKKDERMKIDGKDRTALYIADHYVDLVRERYRAGTMGLPDTATNGEDLEKLEEEYLESKTKAGKSWKTVGHYRETLNALRAENSISTLGQFLLLDFKKYVDDMKTKKSARTGRPLGPTTIRNRIVDLNVFCTWLLAEGRIQLSPVPRKIAPAKVKPSPRFYTDQEWADLENTMASINRFALIGIHLAHDFGLREVEIVGDESGRKGVCWEDIIWLPDGRADLFLRPEVTKGGSGSRKLRLSADFLKLIGPKKTGPLVPLDRGVFWRLFKKARKLSKVNSKLTVHGQRHTFGKDFLQKTGATQAELRDLLGHDDVETTAIYSQFEQTHLDSAMERLHKARNGEIN